MGFRSFFGRFSVKVKPARFWVSLALATILLAMMAGQVLSAPDRFYLRDHGRKITKVEAPTDYVPGEVLVKFQDGTSQRRQNQAAATAGLGRSENTLGSQNSNKIQVYKTAPGVSVERTISKLRASRRVEFAEPNYLYKLSYTPNDPDFQKQWGLNNVGQEIMGTPGTAGVDIGAVNAWDMEQGFSSTVTVAVLDSGMDLDHPDIAGKLWVNTAETPDNGIDDDGNGYVDDVNGFNTAGIGLGMYWVLEGFNPIRPFAGADYEVAQSITGTGASVHEAGFYMMREGLPTAPMKLSIRDDLNGANLAVGWIAPDETSESAVNRTLASLDTTVFMEKNKTYYLVAEIDDPSATVNDHFSIGEASYIEDIGAGDMYREGMQHWKIGGEWLSFPEYDFAFVTGNNGTPHDDNGHGTHVGGIVGAATNNSEGIAGVGPGIEIMPVKAGTSGGGLMNSDIIEAIYYAVDNGADVINMSFGGTADSDLLDQVALNHADMNGVVLVAAAGNSGDGQISYPAAHDNVLGVGATDNRDNRAIFSTFNSSVDFAAPGQHIYSMMPTYPVAMNSSGYLQTYDFVSGTSMASPMVAGAAAVIKAARPSLSPVAVEKILEKGAKDLGAPGRDDKFGYGRIDLSESLRAFLIDTSFLADPRSPNGDNEWYTSAPSISLFASLAPADTFYSWDSTPAVTTYTVPIQLPSEGAHTLYFYSKTPSQTETVDSEVFKLDTGMPVDPANVISPSHTVGAPSSTKVVKIKFAAGTDTVSGVEGYSHSWSENMETPPQAISLLATGADTETIMSTLADGSQWFNLSTKDVAGNWTGTVHLGPFVIDTVKPTGSISVNSGAAYANSRNVTLNLSASDGGSGSGIDKMRVMNEGGLWSAWEAYATSRSWALASTAGTVKVLAQFKDKAGNVSAIKSDTIFLDRMKPTTKLVAPFVATKISKTRIFKVSWSATDPSPSSSIATFDVQYRENGGSWKNWKVNTTSKSASFDQGKVGKTYEFRARADDKAGNVGLWTVYAKTIIPYDNDKLIYRRVGFDSTYENPLSRFYYGTLRFSARSGHEIVYKFTGKRVILISTKAKNRGRAKIYLDGKYVKTIDNFSSSTKIRQIVFHKNWGTSKTHWLKIVNLGTPGRRIFDIDAVAVEQ